MAVKLHIIAETYGEALSVPFEVPDGHIVTVRRHSQGADVFVVPSPNEGQSAYPVEPHGHPIAVHGFTVERHRPGCAELLIVDGDGSRWRLFLGGDAASELAVCLRGGEPVSAQGAHEAALARRANAEAEAMELENAERRRARGADPDASLVAYNWSVEDIIDANGNLAAIDLRLHGDGRAVQGRLSPYLAASLSGQLGQSAARALAEPKRER